MIFFDWKEYNRKFLFREIPIFKENENKNENDFLNFYLCHQYHYIVSSCFHFMTEKELSKKTSNIKYIINEKDLKVYYFQFKGLCPPLLIKYIITNIEEYQYKNEYYISLYGINELRSIIPNFSYCFYQIPKNTQIQTIFEYIDGCTFHDYLEERKNNYNFCLNTEGQIFLSIIFQVVCSLEIAQQTLHFTHFDLHEKNIILRKSKNTNDLIFPIFRKNYKVHTNNIVATMIDFEYSCIRKKDFIISKINPELFKYGYYSVFIPGTDLLRLFLNMKYSLQRYSQNNKIFLSYIHDFVDYVLKFFFHLNFKGDYRKPLYYHSQSFFNMGFSNRIYKNPYSFLLFMEKNKKWIHQMFDIKRSVWDVVSPVEPEKKTSCEEIQKYVVLKNCSEPTIDNLYSYLKNMEIFVPKTEYEFMDMVKNTIGVICCPNIVSSSLSTLKQFFNDYKIIKYCYEYYFHSFVVLKQKIGSVIFSNVNHSRQATTLYRILCCVEYMILLKEKYSDTEYSYHQIEMHKITYL